MNRTQIRYAKRISVVIIALVGYFFAQTQPSNLQGKQRVPSNTPSPVVTVQASSSGLLQVEKVVDGDTFSVLIDGTKQTVRLIGVDTPEVVDPRKPVQCYGQEASKKTKELLTGTQVRLETDPTQGNTDKYNRLLRYAFLADETNVNLLLIADGYAHEYTYQKPYKYQEQFKKAEHSARENKRGLWADGVCN